MSEKQYQNQTHFVFSNEFIGFTTIPNYIFQAKGLSFKAVGIYCSILQFQNSPNHQISIKGLMTIHSDGERSVTSGLNELLDAGFLTREQIREKGQIKGYIYTVYMKPVKVENIDNTIDSPKRHFADTENADMQNVVNKKENKKKKNTKKVINTTEASKDAVVTTQEEVILRETNIKELSAHQKKKVSTWDMTTLIRAIQIYKRENGLYFKLLEKIYKDGAVDSLVGKKSKNSSFTNIYSHDWDLDELEERANNYMIESLSSTTTTRKEEDEASVPVENNPVDLGEKVDLESLLNDVNNMFNK